MAQAGHRPGGLPATLVWLAVAGLSLAVSAPDALGQTAAQVTPDSFQPAPQRRAGAVAFSGAPGLGAPPGAEALSIAVGAVAVEGALPGLEDEARALEARLTRGRIAVAEIFDAAQELEAAHARAGYILARVVLPAQRLTDGGTLRMVVVNGFVETVDASAADPRIRTRIEALTAPLVDRPGLTLREVERRLLLAGDTYGVSLRSALSTGEAQGGTVVVLDPAYRGVTGFVGADNAVASQLGDWSLSAGIELNGLLGFGEAIYARASGNPFDDALRTIAGGVVVPVGTNGLTFNLEATDSRTQPDAAVATTSQLERVSARVFYPWVRGRSFNFTTQLAFDRVTDSLDLDATAGSLPVYEDRLAVARLSGDVFWLSDGGAVTELGGILSVGLDAAGARSAAAAPADTPLSRPGADNDFRRFEIAARHRRALADRVAFLVGGRAQTSFGDPLVLSEQIGIAQQSDISAFPSGDLTGDAGWVVRSEVAYDLADRVAGLPLAVAPYVFAATGSVTLEAPQPGEARQVNAQAFGLGVDLFYTRDPAFSTGQVRIEIGRGLRDDDVADDTRLLVSGSFRF